jgi:hypothetical protein
MMGERFAQRATVAGKSAPHVHALHLSPAAIQQPVLANESLVYSDIPVLEATLELLQR